MKTYLILILIHFCIIASAQQIVPTSINSAGQSSTLNGNNISYSIGDYAVLTLADTNYTVSGSYIAASVITAIEISAVDQGKISVFPNPSSELVYVELSDLLANEIQLSLYTIDGKEIFNQKFNNINQTLTLNLSKQAKGVYILKLRNEKGQGIADYKLIKN
jgi:hypothetical protein